MEYFKNFNELIILAKTELFTALIGDVLDKLGYHHQFLPPSIKPLHQDMIVFGKAMPVLEADCFTDRLHDSVNEYINQPFGIMFKALDNLKKNEVYICTGSSYNYALWGGLMSTRALKLGAAGSVVNGYSRDIKEIISLGFPTFSIGTYAQDQGPRGKVIDYRVPIEIGSVKVNPGDIVYGDCDGVVIVPSKIYRKVINKAVEKARGEKLVKKALEEGMTTVDAFKKYGIM